jgi:hypothetical protein
MVVAGRSGTIEGRIAACSGVSMDQEQLQRFAEVYRQMRDEQLAALLDEQSTLTDEARQALLNVVAERPDIPVIRQRMLGEAKAEADKQAERKTKETARDAQLGGVRPTAGFWLGFLSITLFIWAVWRSFGLYTAIWIGETRLPHLFEPDAFLAFRLISIAVTATILAAAGVGIHAIHGGTTRRHLRRIVAMLWYVTVGAFLITYAALRLLLRPIDDRFAFSIIPFVSYFVIAVIVAALWTAYLLRSQRCRLRYPEGPGEPVLRVFE